jgi:hypothetical protein
MGSYVFYIWRKKRGNTPNGVGAASEYRLNTKSYFGVAMALPGNGVAMPWQCHDNATAMLWQCHGNAMALPWQCHGNAIALPWQCRGIAMASPWHCVSNKNLGEPSAGPARGNPPGRRTLPFL